MSEDLKKETVKGVAWSGIDKIANGGVLFITNIILARLLSPKDFGLLAIITIFVQISQTFIDSGFTNALIQKKDRSQTDYSTVFFFNLAVSIGFYIVLFFCAPLIACFFENEKLTYLTRVVGLNLIIGALVSVHKTRLTIELRFKIQAVISLISSLVSSVTSIFMAYHGYGVWSLVALTLLNITLQVLLIYIIINWRPSFIFSKNAFRSLFSYSSKLLGASLIHLLYRNVYPIVIGKRFSATDLGYFNRADLFASYGPLTIGTVVSRVAFPIFSRIQDDNHRLRIAYSKYIIYSSLIIFPVMIGLIVLAKPLIILVLKDQWLPMVPMLQILCVDWMFDHLNMINLNVLYVKGRSDIAFRNEIIKKTLAIIIFLISLHWDIIGVCWGRVVYGYIAIYINSYYTKRLIGLGIVNQVRDIIKPLCYSLLMGLFVYFISILPIDSYLTIILGTIVGIFVYLMTLYKFNTAFVTEIRTLLSKLNK